MKSKEPFDLPPTADVVFQFLFSSPGSEEALKGFINAVNLSSGRPLIESVRIENPFSLANFKGKKTVVDVKATDSDGNIYDVEMQLLNGASFRHRVLYYWSQLYSGQLHESEKYGLLRPVISIVVARFEMFPNLPDLHNVFTLTAEADSSVKFTSHQEIHTLELTDAKLQRLKEQTKITSENQLQLNHWMDFLLNGNHKTEDEMEEILFQTPGLKKARGLYKQFTASERRRELAIAREKAVRDEADHLEYAINKGLQMGLEQGLELGREQGREQGLEQGRAEGELKAQKNALIIFLSAMFVGQFTEEDQNRILQINDSERLTELMTAIASVKSYEDFQNLI